MRKNLKKKGKNLENNRRPEYYRGVSISWSGETAYIHLQNKCTRFLEPH